METTNVDNKLVDEIRNYIIKNILLVVLFVLVGSICICTGISGKYKGYMLRKTCTETAQARVAKRKIQYNGMVIGEVYDKYPDHATLEFQTNSGTLQTAETYRSEHDYNKDDVIEIKYDPADPSRIYVPGNRSYNEAHCWSNVCVGVFNLFIGARIYKERIADT